MNLEEKAREYSSDRYANKTQNTIACFGFENGGLWFYDQSDSIQKANPKMSASDLVKELKKLI